MNFEQLKEIAKKEKGTLIIVEDGEPSFVIIGFEEYRKKVERLEEQKQQQEEPLRQSTVPLSQAAEPTREPAETELKRFSSAQQGSSMARDYSARGPQAEGELTIDDLPL